MRRQKLEHARVVLISKHAWLGCSRIAGRQIVSDYVNKVYPSIEHFWRKYNYWGKVLPIAFSNVKNMREKQADLAFSTRLNCIITLADISVSVLNP